MEQRQLKAEKRTVSMAKTNIMAFIMFVLLTFIDQFSKRWAIENLKGKDIPLIPDVLEMHYLENSGAAWGILQEKTWLLALISIVVLVAILGFYISISRRPGLGLLRFSLILLAAGAFGNLIDRILFRYVVDFIYVSAIHFPVFNVADSFVCISAILILFCILFKYKDEDIYGEKEDH